jgi:hypothetical protein
MFARMLRPDIMYVGTFYPDTFLPVRFAPIYVVFAGTFCLFSIGLNKTLE